MEFQVKNGDVTDEENNYMYKVLTKFCFFQLKYNNAETKGPCLSIFYPENTNPVSLPVTAVSVLLVLY